MNDDMKDQYDLLADQMGFPHHQFKKRLQRAAGASHASPDAIWWMLREAHIRLTSGDAQRAILELLPPTMRPYDKAILGVVQYGQAGNQTIASVLFALVPHNPFDPISAR